MEYSYKFRLYPNTEQETSYCGRSTTNRLVGFWAMWDVPKT